MRTVVTFALGALFGLGLYVIPTGAGRDSLLIPESGNI